jgi:hypothetical protein
MQELMEEEDSFSSAPSSPSTPLQNWTHD